MLAAVTRNSNQTDQGFARPGQALLDPQQTDWDLLAGILTRNLEESGLWFLWRAASRSR